jgi:hypothetical protein
MNFYDMYKYTLKYVEKEGIHNVRSDSFPQIELSNEEVLESKLLMHRNRIIHSDKNILIKNLELVSFRFEKKKRLKQFFETYDNEDFIVELLSELYKKKIKLMEYELG